MNVDMTREKGGVSLETSAPEMNFPGTAREELKTLCSVFKLKRILVPIDFSPCSRKALQYAVSFARHFDAELCLLHVAQEYYGAPELGMLDMTNSTVAAGRLSAFAREVTGDSIRIETFVRNGIPSPEIVSAAQDLGVDLLIVSTHGYTGLKHAWFGSTAEKVVRHAPCPVLVVRETEHEFINPP